MEKEKTFINNIIKLLDKRGIKQKDFAEKIKTSEVHLSLVLNDKRGCSDDLKERMAEELKIPINLLYRPLEETPQQQFNTSSISTAEEVSIILMRKTAELEKAHKKISRMNNALMATLNYANMPIFVALQDETGNIVSYHMNIEAKGLLGLPMSVINETDFQSHINFVAEKLENSDEWVSDVEKNLLGRKHKNTILHMKDGRKFIWDSKALENGEGEYFGRIVYIRPYNGKK